MSTAAKTGKKAIRIANGIVNMFVLIVVLLLLVFGCYAIWDSKQVHTEAHSKHYEKYKPLPGNEGLSFQSLQQINPEVFAWLTVYGTNIDYPVTQSPDNLKYVNTNALGNYSLSGAIFLDSNCSPDFSDFNSILYGHHMEKQTMFGEIGLFADESYFMARKYGMLYYDGHEHGLEFFTFVHTDAYSTIFRAKVTGPDNQNAYFDLLKKMAIHTRKEVTVTLEDRIILLSTCSGNSTNGRDILIGRITDQIYDDPFMTDQTKEGNSFPVIAHLLNFFSQIPAWARIIIAGLLFLLILLAVILINKKKKRSAKKRDPISGAKGDK